MNKLSLLIALCVASITAFAQDVITTKEGDEIPAKVIKIGESEIEYKKWSNQDGPTYTMNVDKVFMIKYENGENEIFSAKQTENRVSSPENESKQFVEGEGDLLTYTNSSKVYYRGKRLKQSELSKILMTNPEAYDLYKTGKNRELIGNVLGCTGAASLCASLALLMCDSDGFYIFDIVGTAFVVTAIPFWATGSSRLKNSYKKYNDGIMRKQSSAYLGFGISRIGGLAVTLNF